MNIPTKEEVTNERLGHGIEAEDFIFGGEADGIMEFANTLKQYSLSRADETFIEFLIWSPYPYEIDNLIFWWEEYVMRDNKVPIWDNLDVRYVEKYTESQKKSMALAWFDRRIGKLVRVGALNCTMNTGFMNSLKSSFKFSDFIGRIKQRLSQQNDL